MPLDPGMGSGSYVKDFVASKNPKFKGKSKKKRINMALGAFYGAKKEKKDVKSDFPYRKSNSRYES